MSKAPKAAEHAASVEVKEVSLLDQIVDEGRLARDPETRERGKDLIKEFVSQFCCSLSPPSRKLRTMI